MKKSIDHTFAPKSGEQEDHIIPFLEVAKKEITVSIEFGTYAATLSFSLSFNFLSKKKVYRPYQIALIPCYLFFCTVF